MTEFSIIGGNVSGLSAAIHLAEKGHQITVYEKKIWRKPCGGGISPAFLDYLKDQYNLPLNHHKSGLIAHNINNNKVAWKEDRKIVVVIDRRELQAALLNYIKYHTDIDVIRENVIVEDEHLFTKQTIVSTGIQSIGHRLLNSKLKYNKFFAKAYALLIPMTDIKGYDKEYSYICWDIKNIKGYNWLFAGKYHIDVGWGGFKKYKATDAYKRYQRHCFDHHGVEFDKEDGTIQGWAIPITTATPYHNYYNDIDGKQFIATGDLAGCISLVAGAGIETGWLSGHALSVALKNDRIDVKEYGKLLSKNIRYQKPKFLRNDFIYGRLYLSNWGINLATKVLNKYKDRILKGIFEGTQRFMVQEQ